MSGRTFEDQENIREWVRLYLKEYGITSLRQIAAYVYEKANITVMPSTVARLVRRMGYQMKKGEWVKK